MNPFAAGGSRALRLRAALLILAAWLGPDLAVVRAQETRSDRFERFEPGLIVETGARLGACDVLTFTPDGRFLLAVGDDKVVRMWRCTERGIDTDSPQMLRWSIFREQRGNIYALALSPDAETRYVAVGGYGIRASNTPVVLDRVTGQVVKALIDEQYTPGAIWSMAFSPSGRRIAYGKGEGAVLVWDWQAAQGNTLLRLAGHEPLPALGSNKVRLVAFLDDDRLLSLAEDGQLLQWDLTQAKPTPQRLHHFGTSQLWQARLSPDKKAVAMISQRDSLRASVYFLAERRAYPLNLPPGEIPHSLAFDAQSQRLGIATWSPPRYNQEGQLTAAAKARVRLADVQGRHEGSISILGWGPEQGYYMDALAFHPDGKRLAVAGGANHEVTLWDLERPGAAPISTVLGPGRCLWSVALSRDGRYLGFRDQVTVNVRASDVNRRGTGPWRVFDLQRRRWKPPSVPFVPVQPLETLNGWEVRPGTDAQVWCVLAPQAKRPTGDAPAVLDGKTIFALPWDYNRAGLPRCYTFLPPGPTVPGQSPAPVRLAVGHFWGVSIFELHREGPRRSRLMIGHQGEVMAVAPSADGQLLVTASRDQTISAWSLAPWPSQAELGARFVVRQDKVFVDEVDAGSPAWEAGLSRGDEVAVMVFNVHEEMYDPDNLEPKAQRLRMKKILTADECAQRLRQPVPEKEIFFKLRKPGEERLTPALTSVRQRPLWRFFPTHNGEWVLWRWRDYYYDCSTNGDQYIGWQVSGDISITPAFYRAEQFRQRYYRPDKVAEMLAGIHQPEKGLAIPDIEPPEVRLTLESRQVQDRDVTVTMQAAARSDQPNQELDRLLLWVNDCLVETVRLKRTGATERVVRHEQQLTVPHQLLRRGTNLLTLQCYNKAELRGEAPVVEIQCERPARPPRLFGLFVGVSDYSEAHWPIDDLNAGKDAQAMHDAWLSQKDKYYQDVELYLLVDQQASPQAVLARLRDLQRKVQADDHLVFFLGGHGVSAEELDTIVQRLRKNPKAKLPIYNPLPPRSFAFIGPTFDLFKPHDTCLTSQDLYEAIARLPCRKLLLLDTCHSGTFAVNPVRELTRDGVGPVIVTACQPHEKAVEYGMLDRLRTHGLFTMAIRRALAEEFADADHNRDQVLDMDELVTFLKKRVPEFIQRLREAQVGGIETIESQVPAEFLPRLERRVPVARQ